ncbi:MAG TPA: hypothetical protein VMV17_17560 [Streptosporangiaceae bacterium]|nr:hypothetical protein [Streptosporangiaceae bacterium]
MTEPSPHETGTPEVLAAPSSRTAWMREPMTLLSAAVLAPLRPPD